MEIFPAIDLRDGKVVRLTQGDYDRMDIYSDSPEATAISFREQGAQNLHVVDLDGALDGKLSNFSVIEAIVKKSGMRVQIGGGVRDGDRVRKYLEAGASRVILGTVAAECPELLRELVSIYKDKIAVGVDAKNERVAVRGWREVTGLDSVKFCEQLDKAGVKTIIYTDISRDGAMLGTNLEIYRRLAERVGCDIVASGGISSAGELSALKDVGIYGAIVGKALYQGVITLKEALAVC